MRLVGRLTDELVNDMGDSKELTISIASAVIFHNQCFQVLHHGRGSHRLDDRLDVFPHKSFP